MRIRVVGSMREAFDSPDLRMPIFLPMGPTPPRIHQQLEAVARRLSDHPRSAVRAVPNNVLTAAATRVLDFEGLVDRLLSGAADDLGRVQWVYFLRKRECWRRLSADVARTCASDVCRAALEDPWLAQVLMRRVLSGDETMDELDVAFRARRREFGALSGAFRLLDLLDGQDGDLAVSKLALGQEKDPGELFSDFRLARTHPMVSAARQRSAEAWVPVRRRSGARAEEWLVGQLVQLESEAKQRAAEYLLANVPAMETDSYILLGKWLKKHFETLESRRALSGSSQKRLAQWMGTVTFDVFRDWAERIAVSPMTSEWECNQLRKRSVFWGFYSHRFVQIRVFLPEETIELLGLGEALPAEVCRFFRDQSTLAPAEACAFDIGTLLVLEVFRGGGSETWLLPPTAYLRDALFGSEPQSLASLRTVARYQGGHALDHVWAWQRFHAEELWSRGIKPNEGIACLKMTPSKGNWIHVQSSGLVFPVFDETDKQRREEGLARWTRDFARISDRAAKASFKHRSNWPFVVLDREPS